MGSVIKLDSKLLFETHFQRGKDSKKLVVVEFSLDSVRRCVKFWPKVEKLAQTWSEVIFLRVNPNPLKAETEEFGVESFPTFVFFKEGRQIERITYGRIAELGTSHVKELTEKIQRHSTPAP